MGVLLLYTGCLSVSRTDLGSEYISIAQDYFDAKNYVRALEYFQKAESYLSYDDQDISYNIAVIELIRGNLQEAERIITGLKKEDPENLLILELEALLFYQKGYYLAALQGFVTLQDAGMTDVRLVQNIALVYGHLEDNAALVEILEQDEQLNKADFLILLADSYKTLGRLDQAAVIYKKYIDQVKNDEEKLLVAAEFFNEIGDYIELLVLYDVLLAVNGANKNYIFEKAFIQLVHGITYESGLKDLQKALQLNYNDTGRLQTLLNADLFDPASVERVYQEFNIELVRNRNESG